jgi:hypothetical protein
MRNKEFSVPPECSMSDCRKFIWYFKCWVWRISKTNISMSRPKIAENSVTMLFFTQLTKKSGVYVLRRLADVENVEKWLENELANSKSELSKHMRNHTANILPKKETLLDMFYSGKLCNFMKQKWKEGKYNNKDCLQILLNYFRVHLHPPLHS